MLFNSIDFAIFLPIVFALYWLIGSEKVKGQNLLLLAASYVFYGWWDWRFLSLIAFSSCVDYIVGLQLASSNDERKRKLLLFTSLLVNLGFLGFFKYFNFFAESFSDAFSLFGTSFETARLNIILPVGISFYTFQTLSYSIDVYKRRLEPTKDFLSFFAFVSFFPQLVAGPIERASNLLPQFYKKRTFDYASAVDGMRQILWGLFKKIVIADNCAEYANAIFSIHVDHTGSTYILGALFFTFQIYGDFSGYSDIAIGTARLFGFNLLQNFAFPYFSRDIAEFWRRWHISLSTWFRDYLYIPLGGSRGGTWMKVRNTFIIFLVSGFWHGANWTFVIWGGLNAIYFLPLLLTNKNRANLNVAAKGRMLPNPKEVAQISGTFMLTVLAWIFFRAESVSHAFYILRDVFSASLVTIPEFEGMAGAGKTGVLILLFLIVEWWGRESMYGLEKTVNLGKITRRLIYFILIIIILVYGEWGTNAFIYFQF